jgi:hypothetical protein
VAAVGGAAVNCGTCGLEISQYQGTRDYPGIVALAGDAWAHTRCPRPEEVEPRAGLEPDALGSQA